MSEPPLCRDQIRARVERLGSKTDSPQEGTGFEPSVPLQDKRRSRDNPFRLCGTSRSARKADSFRERDRQFESPSLHQRVLWRYGSERRLLCLSASRSFASPPPLVSGG